MALSVPSSLLLHDRVVLALNGCYCPFRLCKLDRVKLSSRGILIDFSPITLNPKLHFTTGYASKGAF
jgi:hypothetical protein